MALSDLNAIIDLSTGNLIANFTGVVAQSSPITLRQRSVYNLNLRFVLPNPVQASGFPWIDSPLGSGSLSVKVAADKLPPYAGTFTITDPVAGQTTGAIPWNATTAAIQAAIAVALTTNYSTCIVTGSLAQGFNINAGANGALAALTVSTSGLTPQTDGVVYVRQVGTSSVPAIFVLVLQQSAACLQTSFSAFPSAGGAVTRLQAGGSGFNEVQQITLNPQPYNGVWGLSWVSNAGGAALGTLGPIYWNDTAQSVQISLGQIATIGPANIIVTKSATNVSQWTVTFVGSLGNLAMNNLLVIQPAGLQVPVGLTGTLSAATTGVEELLAQLANAAGIAGVQIEVVWTPGGGSPVTLYRGPCNLQDSLLTGADAMPTALGGGLGLVIALGATAYTGGTYPTDLDGWTTAGVLAGTLYLAVIGGVGKLYALTPGNNTANGTTIIRPGDWDLTTNNVYLVQVL